MNDFNPMVWQSFKSALLKDPEKTLQFQYAEGQFVDASYHITEIKQAPIVSVDCGGVINSWTEVIVQLYEPLASATDRAMQVSKALSIINTVEKLLPLNPDAVVKIEFGNSKFDTRQMYPAELLVESDTVTVNLVPDFTQCKALSRGGSCGTDAKNSETACCSPAVNDENLLIKVLAEETVGVEELCCTPGSGCC